MFFEDQTHLRLAARVLIEWRTPKESAEYQEILHKIIAHHPLTKEVDIARKTELMDLDDDSIILWYLSDSMNRSVRESSGKNHEVIPHTELDTEHNVYETKPDESASTNFSDIPGLDDSDAWVINILNELTYVSATDNATQAVWAGGPTRAKLADAISQSITNNDLKLMLCGYRAYFAVKYSLTTSIMRESVNELLDKSHANLIQKLSKSVDLAFRSSISIGTITALALIHLFFDKFISSSNLSGFMHNIESMKLTIVGTIVGMIITTIISGMSFMLTKNQVSRELILKSLLNTVFRRSKEYLRDSALRHYGKLAVGIVCGITPGILASILKQKKSSTLNSSDMLTAFILRETRVATPEVVREMLCLLQFHELNEKIREQIFLWLLKVNILSQDEKHPKSDIITEIDDMSDLSITMSLVSCLEELTSERIAEANFLLESLISYKALEASEKPVDLIKEPIEQKFIVFKIHNRSNKRYGLTFDIEIHATFTFSSGSAILHHQVKIVKIPIILEQHLVIKVFRVVDDVTDWTVKIDNIRYLNYRGEVRDFAGGTMTARQIS